MIDFDQLIAEMSQWFTSDLLLQFALFLIWVIFIVFVTWVIRKAMTRTITDNAVLYRAKKVARLVSYLLIVLLAVISFTSKVQYFTIAIGLLSAGIAFALQEVILSVAGWIAIFTTNIYKPGDRIEMNGVKGDVIDIGITKTTLMEMGVWVKSDNYSGRIVQLSNGYVFKGPVHNYSTDFPFVWDEIDLPVRYGSDLKLAQQLILDIANTSLMEYAKYAQEHWKEMVRKYLIEDVRVEPTLTFKLTDNWVEFNLRYVVDYQKRRFTKNGLYSEIYEAIQKTEGKVQLASATFELVGLPDLKMDVRQ